jgi:putative oxygen-independent coproporphyrinogen III oxidase
MAMQTAPSDFGIYVHWPFCQSKCPYCDFNSHVAEKIDQRDWAAAFESEIDRLGDEIGPKLVSSIYFGGGTPSLMQPDTVDRILTALRRRFSWRNDIEVTLEANPSSVEVDRFVGYRQAGVNRISMGFQAMNDADLKALGRLHSAETALHALQSARSVFSRVSFDLIYARQNQTLVDWQEELSAALALGPTHLSLYQLTVEDGTAFAQRFAAGSLRGLPDENLSFDLFMATQQLCDDYGLPAYEVSNHAIPGAESKHNLIYWRGGDYLGVGPGAHGRITVDGRRFATVAPKAPGAWLHQVQLGNTGEDPREELTPLDWAQEFILMGLRTTEGIDLGRLTLLTGKTLAEESIFSLQTLGLICREGPRLQTTLQGRLVLNGVIRDLTASLS